jgi:hypothetical protein
MVGGLGMAGMMWLSVMRGDSAVLFNRLLLSILRILDGVADGYRHEKAPLRCRWHKPLPTGKQGIIALVRALCGFGLSVTVSPH